MELAKFTKCGAYRGLIVCTVCASVVGQSVAETISIGSGEIYRASDLASVEALQNATAISIASGGVLEYSDSSNALVLNAPISGGGAISNTTGKSMVVLGDNSGFTGEWHLVSPVVVSNRYGLGTGNTKGVYFESGASGNALKFGGAGLTNDVPIFFTVASPSGSVIFRDASDLSGPFVQNGLITYSKAVTISTHDAIYRGGVKETLASVTFGMPLNSKYNNTCVRFENKPVNGGGGHLVMCGENSDVVHYYFDVAGNKCGDRFYLYRAYLHCGAENVLPVLWNTGEPRDVELGGKYSTTQWKTAVLDLNGFNQKARSVYCNWYGAVLEADGETFVTEVTSATPATLTLTNDQTRTTATKYTGRVSLDCNGSGTYTLANLLSTSTGTLSVGDGFTVGFKWNAGWSGDVVVKSGGTLVLDSARAFLGKKSRIVVEEGGAISLTENAVVELASLQLGDVEIPGGEFSPAGIAAAGLGGFVTGTGKIVIADHSDSAVARGTNARDGLIYELLPTNVTAAGEWVAAGDIADGATWSAAAPFAPYGLCAFNPSSNPTSYAKYGTPDPLAIKEVEVPVSYFSKMNIRETCNALCFPKNVRTYDEGDGRLSTNVYRLGVCYSSLPSGLQGLTNMTVRIRLLWDGNVKQPTKICYDQYIMQLYNTTKNQNILALTTETYDPTTQSSRSYLRFKLGVDELTDSGVSIVTNQWHDIFVSIKGIEGGKSSVTVGKFYWDSSDGAFDRRIRERNFQFNVSVGDFGCMYLGCGRSQFDDAVSSGHDSWDSSFVAKTLGSFNGAIAKFEIYDHAMTLQEMNAVMHDPGSGCSLKIGSMNASADEFAAVDDPQSVTVFDPRTDSVRRFRKALTASNPSASIRFAMKPEENRLPRTLKLRMERKDVVASAPIAVFVNGAFVETVDFGSVKSALVFLQPRFMKRDQDGYVTITLSRPSGCLGSLLFDTVELSGSWAAGISNRSSSDWSFCPTADFFHCYLYRPMRWSLPGGVWNRSFIPNTIYGWRKDMCENGQPLAGNTPYIPAALLAFDVPAEIIEQGGGTLTIGTADTNSRVEFDVLANGVNVGHVTGVTSGASYDFNLPSSVLVSGLNSLVISNSGANFAESASATSYNSFSFDYIQFKAEVPPRNTGTLMIFQ